VVVPVCDRAAQLARCLDSLRAADGRATIVVVDDGSADPDAVRAAASARGARVIRHDVPAGAAAARNTGLAACTTPVVAFVDSDVVVPADWAPRLLGHFADPCVGAVAPRIRALPPARGLIGGYESRHSPLDMGAEPACVGPGRTIPYVPSAVLAMRRAAAGAGFDAAMPIGEDVDLVWRLVERRWRVVYTPDVEVRHDHRLRLRAFVDRRRVYASSVAPLARRHPGALPAAHLSAWTAVPWALLLAGSRRAAFAATLVEVGLVARRLSAVPGAEPRLAAALVARGLLASGAGLGRAARRAWAPALGVAAVRRRGARRALALAFAAAIAEDAVHARRLRPGDVVMRALDEAVALWGTWEGCIRHRTLTPLLPASRDRGATPPSRRTRRGLTEPRLFARARGAA
jgi:mycofactocin system glycosyltransferase